MCFWEGILGNVTTYKGNNYYALSFVLIKPREQSLLLIVIMRLHSAIKQKPLSKTTRTADSLQHHPSLPSPTADLQLRRLKVDYANLLQKYQKLKKKYESQTIDLNQILASSMWDKSKTKSKTEAIQEMEQEEKRYLAMEEENKMLRLEVRVVRNANQDCRRELEDIKQQMAILEKAKGTLHGEMAEMARRFQREVQGLRSGAEERESSMEREIEQLKQKIRTYQYAEVLDKDNYWNDIDLPSDSGKSEIVEKNKELEETFELIRRRLAVHQKTYDFIEKAYLSKQTSITVIKLIDLFTNYDPWALNFSQFYPLLVHFFGDDLMFKTKIDLALFLQSFKQNLGEIRCREQFDENKYFDEICLKFSKNLKQLKKIIRDRPEGLTKEQLKVLFNSMGMTQNELIEYALDKLAVCSEDMDHLEISKWINAIDESNQ